MTAKIVLIIAVAGFSMLILWYLNGAMVTPVRGGENIKIEIGLKVSGAAPELEHTICGLLWLIENGTVPGEIVIFNDGCDDYTRLTAEMLARDDGRIHLSTLGEPWSRIES